MGILGLLASICATLDGLSHYIHGFRAFGKYNKLQISLWTFAIRFAKRPLAGGVAEWSNALVLKTSEGVSLPWVRIPPPPPLAQIETRMCPDTGVIFFMFQRGLGLATEPARMPERLDTLSNPRFSLSDRTSGRFGSVCENPIK